MQRHFTVPEGNDDFATELAALEEAGVSGKILWIGWLEFVLNEDSTQIVQWLKTSFIENVE